MYVLIAVWGGPRRKYAAIKFFVYTNVASLGMFIGFVTLVANGMPTMGGKLLGSFFFNLLVGVFCAYLVSRTVVPTTDYLEVFRISGTVAFVAYSVAYVQDSIWFGRPWSITAKSFLDALIYALLTGGVFGWLVA